MKRRRIIPVLLCMMLILLGAGTAVGTMKEEVRSAAKGLRTALEGKDEMILNRQEILPAGSPQSDWAAMALALAGEKDHYQVYAKNLETYVKGQGMTWKTKIRVMVTVTLLMSFGFLIMFQKALYIPCAILGAVWLFHIFYFCLGVKNYGIKEKSVK